MSIAQLILQKSTDFLRRIIAAEEQGGVTLSSYLFVPSLPPILYGRLHLVGLIGAREEAVQLAVCGMRWPSTNRRTPDRISVKQDSTDRREASVFRAHAAPHRVCDTLSGTLKLLANQHHDSDSLVRVLV